MSSCGNFIVLRALNQLIKMQHFYFISQGTGEKEEQMVLIPERHCLQILLLVTIGILTFILCACVQNVEHVPEFVEASIKNIIKVRQVYGLDVGQGWLGQYMTTRVHRQSHC